MTVRTELVVVRRIAPEGDSGVGQGVDRFLKRVAVVIDEKIGAVGVGVAKGPHQQLCHL